MADKRSKPRNQRRASLWYWNTGQTFAASSPHKAFARCSPVWCRSHSALERGKRVKPARLASGDAPAMPATRVAWLSGRKPMNSQELDRVQELN